MMLEYFNQDVVMKWTLGGDQNLTALMYFAIESYV